MVIRRLTKDDASSFWELRFKALREDGDAFGATYEEEVSKPLDNLIVRFNNEYIEAKEDNFILGAFNEENKMIGVIGLHRERRIKLRHKATIWGMYVSKEYRKKRFGKLLLFEVLNIAKSMEGLEQLNLCVVSSNIKAKNLYESMNFETYAIEKNAIKFDNKYFDEEYMVYFVK